MHTDPIADMLTRIRNAQAVKKSEVVLPFSKIKLSMAELLQKEGWLKGVEVLKTLSTAKKKSRIDNLARFDRIKIGIVYEADGTPKIKNLKRVSTPGRRVYAPKDNLPKVLGGRGLSIISTSHGILSDREAREKKLGGEVMCEIY